MNPANDYDYTVSPDAAHDAFGIATWAHDVARRHRLKASTLLTAYAMSTQQSYIPGGGWMHTVVCTDDSTYTSPVIAWGFTDGFGTPYVEDEGGASSARSTGFIWHPDTCTPEQAEQYARAQHDEREAARTAHHLTATTPKEIQ